MQYQLDPKNDQTHHVWGEFVQGYLPKGIISHCPSSSGSAYGLHWRIFRDGPLPWESPYTGSPMPVTAILRPSETIMMLELGQHWTNTWSYGGFHPDPWYWPSWANRIDCDAAGKGFPAEKWEYCGVGPRFRHNGAVNALFVDGHVKAMSKGLITWRGHLSLSSF